MYFLHVNLPNKKDGNAAEVESEIDLIIEENGILYPIEIKQGTSVTADETSAFLVLDKVDEKKRGTGQSSVTVLSRDCCGRMYFKSLFGTSSCCSITQMISIHSDRKQRFAGTIHIRKLCL